MFAVFSVMLLFESLTFAVTLTVGNGSGTASETIQIPITVDDPVGIAGAAFTITYDTDNLYLSDIQSDFFDTFDKQWGALTPAPDPYPPSSVVVDSITYPQPLLQNLVTGTGVMIAAARCSAETSPSKTTLFTLSFTLKPGASTGTYEISIIPTTLNDTSAGYSAGGETIDLLIGADPAQPVTSKSAFPVLLDDDGYAAYVNNGYVTFTAGSALEISLWAGWNLISLYKQPADTAIESVLAAISGKYISVWAYVEGKWKVYDPNNPGFSDLTIMEAGKGYWINMNESGNLPFSGSDPSGSISLASGWNLVGYNSTTSQSIVDALASIEGKYVSVWAYIDGSWKVYDPANPGFSDLTTMEPGYGYWINAMETCTWIQ